MIFSLRDKFKCAEVWVLGGLSQNLTLLEPQKEADPPELDKRETPSALASCLSRRSVAQLKLLLRVTSPQCFLSSDLDAQCLSLSKEVRRH